MLNITISRTQATQFANTVFADIKEYIQTHQEEFTQYIAENGEKNK